MSTRIGRRIFRLKELMGIRVGPGAAILPKEVTKIQMRLARNIDDGHRGPKKFFKEMLPRLKYRNPAVVMTADRSAAQTDPAIMTVFFAAPHNSDPSTSAAKDTIPTNSTTASTTPSEYTPARRTVEIQMKHLSESEILARLYEVTGAKQIEPTEVEKDLLQDLARKKELNRLDSLRGAELKRQKKREAELLTAAKAGINLNAV